MRVKNELLTFVVVFAIREDTALFFDTLGFLDANMFTALVQSSPATTPPKFFTSQSSQDSNNNNSNENASEGESGMKKGLLSYSQKVFSFCWRKKNDHP